MKYAPVSRLFALTTATSAIALSAPAMAQGTGSNDEATDRNIIIVTAQKKEQDLQDVPITIAAFNAEQLEAQRIEGVEDLGRVAPGVAVTPNPADPTGVRVVIRGVGTFDPQIGQDSRVAIYQDGVYLGKTQGLVFDMPDLERVEIVKGPQGTLYGRNSVAGAVNLISARPDGEWDGEASFEYGRFNSWKATASVNIPVSDTGGLRLSALVKDQDGWVENLGPGADFGGGNAMAFRGTFGGELSPNFSAYISIDYSKTEQEPLFYQSIPGSANPGSLFAASVGTSPGRQRQVTTSFTNEKGNNETYGGNVTLEWDVADNHSLRVIGAYRTLDSSRFVTLVPTANPLFLFGTLNADIIPDNQVPGVQSFANLIAGTALAFQLTGQPLRADFVTPFQQPPGPQTGLFLSPPGGGPTLDGHEQYSLEATLTGDFGDGRFEYTLGAFYYDEFTSSGFNDVGNPADVNSYLFLLAGFNPAIGTPIVTGALTAAGLAPFQNFLPPAQFQALVDAQLGPIVGDVNGAFNPVTLVGLYGEARQSAANDLRIDTEAFALYGEFTFNITDALAFTAGARYSDESKSGFQQPKSPFFLDNIDLLGRVIPPNIADIDFDVFNWSAVLTYEPTDDLLFYASYKESFRSGGFNAAAVGPRLPGQTFGADFAFGREDISAYEAGAKMVFGGGRFRLNAAGFYYDFTDQQTTVALNPLIATSRAIVNTDEEIWGIELDAFAQVTDSLSLFAQYSWIDGDAGDVTNPLTGQIEIRDQLQGTPENSFSVGFNFDTELTDSIGLFANGSYYYQDEQLSIPQNQLFLTDRNIVNGRIGIDFDVGNSEMAIWLWGENIFDDKYTIDGLPFETFAFRTTVFAQPATYGIGASVEF